MGVKTNNSAASDYWTAAESEAKAREGDAGPPHPELAGGDTKAAAAAPVEEEEEEADMDFDLFD